MSKTTQITVTDFKQVHQGVTSDNRPWTMYNVIASDGKRYTTFQDKYRDAVGKTIQIEYEEKPSTKVNPKTGQPYAPNLTIIEPKKQPTQSGIPPQIMEKLFEKLDRIEKKLDMLTVGDEVAAEPDSTQEIDPSEIPF